MLPMFKYDNRFCGWNTAIVVLLAVFVVAPAAAEEEVDALWAALTGGKPDFAFRLRYEHVDDEALRAGSKLDNADALTARATLGYRTGMFHKFSAYLQFEAVGALSDDYYDGPRSSGTRNLVSTVADPEGTEVNQGYLTYTHDDKFSMKLGRQIMTYRKAPFHRFMGTVLWRQNWQTQDAFTFAWQPLDKLNINYGYIWNTNRIFGEDAPGAFDDFEMDSHVINVQYGGFKYLKLEAYAYLLEMENAGRFSNDTFGIRANGVYPLNDRWGLLYTAEFAHQEDAANNPTDYDDEYFLGEIGLKTKFDGFFVKTLMAKFSYELLGGDGSSATSGFITPLATLHAFQGWADRFLVTPGAGIEDFIVTAVAGLDWNMKFIMAYHNLNSDEGSFDYGDEIDVLLTKKFMKHYVVGAKASFYGADTDYGCGALTCNSGTGGVAKDVTKAWVWFQFKF